MKVDSIIREINDAKFKNEENLKRSLEKVDGLPEEVEKIKQSSEDVKQELLKRVRNVEKVRVDAVERGKAEKIDSDSLLEEIRRSLHDKRAGLKSMDAMKEFKEKTLELLSND